MNAEITSKNQNTSNLILWGGVILLIFIIILFILSVWLIIKTNKPPEEIKKLKKKYKELKNEKKEEEKEKEEKEVEELEEKAATVQREKIEEERNRYKPQKCPEYTQIVRTKKGPMSTNESTGYVFKEIFTSFNDGNGVVSMKK